MRKVVKGILLKRLSYSETSLILHFYTRENGFQAYVFQGGKKKKGNMLHPLSIVEISSFHRGDSGLGKISEIHSAYVAQEIPFHPIKSGVAFFMAEVLANVLHESDNDEHLFDYLEEEIQWLDHSNELSNYPIWFLISFAQKMGVGIHVENEKGHIFNLQEGIISNTTPLNNFYINDELVPIFIDLLASSKMDFLAMGIHKTYRQQLMEQLLNYYHLHFNNFRTPKSIEIVQLVLAE